MKTLAKIILGILAFIVLSNCLKDEPTPAERNAKNYEIYGEKAKYFVFSDM